MGDRLDFKLNYYFNEFKDKPFSNVREFKQLFKSKYGDFIYLNELILMINKYQIRKYGNSLVYYSDIINSEEYIKKSHQSTQRKYNSGRR